MPWVFPCLLLLFAASGCAALIYEIVWFQLLELVIGSSAVSLGTLLATYMGGMFLGSLAYARVVSERRDPLRVYAAIEAGIGLCGLAVVFGLPLLDRLYAAHAGHGLAGIFLRALVSALCLLVPTVLMGASLPALARQWKTSPESASRLGFLYGANTAGAIAGCLVAGFYLLRVYDMHFASYVAVAINAVVALAAWAASGRAARAGEPAEIPFEEKADARAIYAVTAISGLCALGAEVIWTRSLSLMLGATVYAFSIILAVFLTGLGIGSALGSWLARRLNPRRWLGICQVILAFAVSGTAWRIAHRLPYWTMPSAASPWYTLRDDLLRSLATITFPALFWGASFPLALAAVSKRGSDSARLAGSIYAANTFGAILGALGFSMLLIPALGTQNSQRLLVLLCAVAAFLALPRARTVLGILLLTAKVGLLSWRIPPFPWQVFAYGREITISYKDSKPLFVGEGRNASIAVTQIPDGTRFFHISGKVEASTLPQDMRLQRMLGHLPALFHPKPRSVLVVGCGAGVTAGTFVTHPEVERILICELEPLVARASATHFAKENHNVLRDRRTEIVYDDARHYVRTTPERFDIITSDPIHPWVKGAATLYSREYFETVKSHLKPGGVVTQWVPLYQTDAETVRSEIATFASVFPNATIWNNDLGGEGYDILLLGQLGPSRIDIDALARRLSRPDYAAVRDSLEDVGLSSPLSLLATYGGRVQDLQPWLAHAQINRDRNLRLQYLAGLAMPANNATDIMFDLLRYRRVPSPIFTGSAPRMQSLYAMLRTWQ
ncbi:MAG TPA: fused MFS/spermidine synthase [Bryobacteraceae bacterium]|nr:fused MFS/spermidine synthase [Bryobacteraceae bacterium]